MNWVLLKAEIKTNIDYLSILKDNFDKPCLSLVSSYLESRNYKNQKPETLRFEFSRNHNYIFKILFLLDFTLRFIFLSVLLFVVLRGLGILDYILDIFDKILNCI